MINKLKNVTPKMMSPMFWCILFDEKRFVDHQKITITKARMKEIEFPKNFVAREVNFSNAFSIVEYDLYIALFCFKIPMSWGIFKNML